jgi:hypothetical protein
MGALGDCQSRFDVIREDIMHPIESKVGFPILGWQGLRGFGGLAVPFALVCFPTLMGALGEIQSQSMLLMLLRG